MNSKNHIDHINPPKKGSATFKEEKVLEAKKWYHNKYKALLLKEDEILIGLPMKVFERFNPYCT